MRFILTDEHLYPWPVTIEVPDPDRPGEILEQKFTARFRAMPVDEAQALDDEIEALPPKDRARRQDDLLRRVLIGWGEDVVDDGGRQVPFTPEALERAIRHSWFRIGVYRAYRQSLQGRAAALGN